MTGTECCRAAMTIMGAGADSSEYYAQFALGALNQLIANSLREINAERVQQGEAAFSVPPRMEALEDLHFHRLLRWSVMRQPPKHQSQRLLTAFQEFLFRQLSVLPLSQRLSGCLWADHLVSLWQEAFLFLLSVVHVHLGLPHRLLSWLETEWVQRTEFCLKQQFLWKKQERYRLLR